MGITSTNGCCVLSSFEFPLSLSRSFLVGLMVGGKM